MITGSGDYTTSNVVINDTYNGLPIVAIADNAFKDNNITSLTIGNNVKSIGKNAFSGCLKLENITIPNSVESIGENAFGYCDSLTKAYYAGSASNWSEIISIGDTLTACRHLGKIKYQNIRELSKG